ncbi:hypothetical protein [Paractinoplanes abujensis]|uniref:Type I site-specific restriction endonuclease n=1 Tax=Paractinoplanes abujensis TaxID=882441 RepID=A0A7W7G1F5_9ACTN|nr:hypothetical protein [Actinoplanes abujensis]MBB4692604.1 type I site-specific restriction endonuclease [Actinoplanes abujensis]
MPADDWRSDPSYADYPAHDLHGVPLAILEAARAYMRIAAEYNDVSEEFAEPLADGVVREVLPLIRAWLSGADRPPRLSQGLQNDSEPS